MNDPPTLLDTDIVSALMRRDATATARARIYFADHHQYTFSAITRFEVLRGLLVRRTTVRAAEFQRLCLMSQILPLTDAVIDRAAVVYADLHRRGALIGDCDILIAATALEQGLALATNNEAHFGRIPGLTIDNWLN
ncbi:MAG: type II toxin-antitoxin system VapC family toxin [Planctomycetaceae bacterium]